VGVGVGVDVDVGVGSGVDASSAVPHADAEAGPFQKLAPLRHSAGSAASDVFSLTRSSIKRLSTPSRQRSVPVEPAGFRTPIQYGIRSTIRTSRSSSTTFQAPGTGATTEDASSASGSTSRSL
jgi:hypothetical protein